MADPRRNPNVAGGLWQTGIGAPSKQVSESEKAKVVAGLWRKQIGQAQGGGDPGTPMPQPIAGQPALIFPNAPVGMRPGMGAGGGGGQAAVIGGIPSIASPLSLGSPLLATSIGKVEPGVQVRGLIDADFGLGYAVDAATMFTIGSTGTPLVQAAVVGQSRVTGWESEVQVVPSGFPVSSRIPALLGDSLEPAPQQWGETIAQDTSKGKTGPKPAAPEWRTIQVLDPSVVTANEIKNMTKEEHAWLNSNLGDLMSAIAATYVEAEKTKDKNISDETRHVLKILKTQLDELKDNDRLWWARGGAFEIPEESVQPTQAVHAFGQTGVDMNGMPTDVLIGWEFAAGGMPSPCGIAFCKMLMALTNELYHVADTSGESQKKSRAEKEHDSNTVTKNALIAFKKALRLASDYPSDPGTSRIREWIAGHKPCKNLIDSGITARAIEAAMKRVDLSEYVEVEMGAR